MGTRVAVMITQATRYGTFVCGGGGGREHTVIVYAQSHGN